MVEVSMDLPVVFDMGYQAIDVGGDEFGVFAVFKNLANDRVLGFDGTEDLDRSARGFAVSEIEFLKEKFSDLLGGGDVKGITGEGMDFLFDFVAFSAVGFSNGKKFVLVKREAFKFHLGQDGGERDFDVIEEVDGLVFA